VADKKALEKRVLQHPFLYFLIPEPDDGNVSVKRTKVEGMNNFPEVPYSHCIYDG